MTRKQLAMAITAVAFVATAISMYHLGKRSADTGPDSNPYTNGGHGNPPPPPGSTIELSYALKSRFSQQRAAVYVSVDKPVYKRGETVRVRGVCADAYDRTLFQNACLSGRIQILGPKDEELFSTYFNGNSWDNSPAIGGSWDIPPYAAGGEYKVIVEGVSGNSAPVSRKFEVRVAPTPRLRIQLKFQSDGYGPGDTVVLNVEANRTGGPAEGATVSFTARVDGVAVAFGEGTPVDSNGKSQLSFALPNDIAKGDGQVVVSIDDSGVREQSSKTLPILLQAVDVDIYGESGDLIAGLPNRVYVEATAPSGDPADIFGIIFDKTSNTAIGNVTTAHEGRGVSSYFVPDQNAVLELRMTKPTSIKVPVALPAVKSSGVSMIALHGGVYDVYTAVHVLLAASPDMIGTLLRVSVAKRERDVVTVYKSLRDGDGKGKDSGGIPVPDGVVFSTLELQLPPSAWADGVLRVTVYNSVTSAPLAERLVYRIPASRANVTMITDKSSYSVGETVTMTVNAATEDGKPINGNVFVTVVDDTVLQSIPARLLHPRLPAMALLEHDVMHFDDPGAYNVLPSLVSESRENIDLLLGAQGWRRFALQSLDNHLYGQGAAQVPKAARKFSEKEFKDKLQTAFEIGQGGMYGGGFGGVNDAGFAREKVAMGAPKRGGFMPLFAQPMARPMMHQEAAAADGAPEMVAAPAMAMADAPPVDFFDQGEDAPPADAAAGGFVQNLAMDNGVRIAEHPGGDLVLGRAPEPDRDAPDIGIGMAAPAMPPIALRDDAMAGDMPMRAQLAPMPMMKVRPSGVDPSYAHQHIPYRMRKQRTRTDFTTTLFWKTIPVTVKDGVATVKFDLSDSVTTFRAMADVLTKDGLLGQGDALIDCQLPTYAEVKLPVELTVGDVAQVPVTVIIPALGKSEGGAALVTMEYRTSDGLQIKDASQASQTWTQTERGHLTHVDTLAVAATQSGVVSIVVNDAKTGQTDNLERSVPVKNAGFPGTTDFGGLLKPDVLAHHTIVLDDNVISGSVNVSATVYASPVGSLMSALEALIQEPCGCFEQTSSTTYPLVMAQMYFKTHSGVDPVLIDRAHKHLRSGYEKLTSFETRGGGFEWFGGYPAHEALTAYGALEFQDMSQVFPVDQALLQRTKEWLRSRANGSGGFMRDPKALDSFGRAPDEITNAYIVWSLVSAGETGLDKEIKYLVKLSKESDTFAKDPYFLGLVAATLYQSGRRDEGKTIATHLASLQREDGSIPGVTTSITCSTGDSLNVESSSIAVLAWLLDDEFAANARAGMDWIVAQCKNGRFGSTQGTVLALKAIIAYDVKSASPKANGYIEVTLNGDTLDTVEFLAGTEGALKFNTAKILEKLKPRTTNAIGFKMTSDNPATQMPYSIHVSHASLLPQSAAKCAITLTTTLSHSTLAEGDATEVKVAITHSGAVEARPLPMIVARIRLPGGLLPRLEKLRELKQTETIAAYEVQNREVILYWRGLDAAGSINFSLDAIATFPGRYTGEASVAYLYYTDELKSWASGLPVTVSAK